MTTAPDAWADYWRGGTRRGCAEGAAGLNAATARVWSDLAGRLPPRARVLDLGTGAGEVLAALARARTGLRLEGVDLAPALPPAPPGVRLRAGVAMEELPFPDGRFDAVVSQFGFEYADADRAAAEAARVLAPGGALLLVVHHADGPVVRHNRGRAEALGWAVGPDGPVSRARVVAEGRRLLPALPVPPAVQAAPAAARAAFPAQSVAAEIATAALQSLSLQPAAHALAALARLDEKAQGETARITALVAAARDHIGIEVDAARFTAGGLLVESPVTLTEQAGAPPFAWLLRATKPA